MMMQKVEQSYPKSSLRKIREVEQSYPKSSLRKIKENMSYFSKDRRPKKKVTFLAIPMEIPAETYGLPGSPIKQMDCRV